MFCWVKVSPETFCSNIACLSLHQVDKTINVVNESKDSQKRDFIQRERQITNERVASSSKPNVKKLATKRKSQKSHCILPSYAYTFPLHVSFLRLFTHCNTTKCLKTTLCHWAQPPSLWPSWLFFILRKTSINLGVEMLQKSIWNVLLHT